MEIAFAKEVYEFDIKTAENIPPHNTHDSKLLHSDLSTTLEAFSFGSVSFHHFIFVNFDLQFNL